MEVWNLDLVGGTFRRIPVTNTFGWYAVAFCACQIITLIFVVFYVIKDDHKFDFRLVSNGTPNNFLEDVAMCFGAWGGLAVKALRY
jgi:hypothetical protein